MRAITFLCLVFSTAQAVEASLGSQAQQIFGNVKDMFTASKCQVYTVAAGDSCDSIAQSHGITVDKLHQFNHKLDCKPLDTGKRLCVTSGPLPPPTSPNPNGSCEAHMVADGDTCDSIATAYSVSVKDIKKWNRAAHTYKWTGCLTLQRGFNICVSPGTAPPVPTNPKLQCGPESPGHASCPLNACCSAFGYCGLTNQFCHKKGKNPCIKDCFMPSLPSCDNTAKRNMAYYAGWGARRSCDAVGPDKIRLAGLTHVNFAFATITRDFKISITDADSKLLKTLVSRKGEVDGLKVLIAVGGWAFSEEDPTKDIFSLMIANPENRRTFIASVKKFLKDYKLDGIDIDFEYPGAVERNAPPTDTPHLTAFFKELRAGLGKSTLISVATPAGYWFLKGFEIDKIMKYVDWANMMSYDYHGQWDTDVSGQPSVANPQTSILDIKDSTLLYRRAGIDLHKVNLGLAWYARTFDLDKPSCGKYGCHMTGGGKAGKCSKTKGYLTQMEVEKILGDKKPTFDEKTGTYYFVHDSDLITFDQDKSWELKQKFANDHCFGGTFVWSLDQRDPSTVEPPRPPKPHPCTKAKGLAKKYTDSLMDDFETASWNPISHFWVGCGCITSIPEFYQEGLTFEAIADYSWESGDTDPMATLIGSALTLRPYIVGIPGEIPFPDRFGGSRDDALWWAIALMKIWDYHGRETGDYMDAAKAIMSYVAEDQDDGCAGGIWWSDDEDYKNTIVNALYIYARTTYHTLTKDKEALEDAKKVWDWVKKTGLRNPSTHLYNDGADDNCKNNGQTYWTYNQGLMISSAGMLYQATGDKSYLDWGKQTLDAVVNGPLLTKNGILQETCDSSGDCNSDQHGFKGIFMMHLQYFLDVADDEDLIRRLGPWIGKQINAVHASEDSDGNPGNNWAGSANQHYGADSTFSALMAANAAEKYGGYLDGQEEC